MNKKKLVLIPLMAVTSSLFAQFSGINTTSPGTSLDVNGAITNRETAVAIASNAATIPANVSQVQLTGTATATVAIAAPTAPNAGQRLIIFNNTTGGFGATLNGVTIPNGKALEYVYSNSGWRSTDGGSVGATPVNIYTANGTLASNRTVTQGANTLTFTGNQVNAFSVAGSAFSVDAANNRVGIGTTTPSTKLTISTPDNTFGLKHTNGTIDLQSYIGSGAAWLGTTTAHDLRFETNNTPRMYISAGGNVGIGISTPNAPLHLSAISSTSAITSSFLTPGMFITGPTGSTGYTGPGLYFEGLSNPANQRVMKVNMTTNGTTGFLNFQSVSDNGSTNISHILSILSTGNVGIGTIAPLAKLHISGNGGSVSSTAGAQSYFNAGTGISTVASGGWNTPLSIYATDGILSQSFIASQAGTFTASDSRTKDLKGLSNPIEDLATINKIEITNYTMKDKVRFGDKAYKKVIAQQVERVYPQAITKRADYIPDVYELSEKVVFENGQTTITLSKVHQMKAGDQVKMLTESGEEVFATVASAKTYSFTVNHVDNQQPCYFVYGTKVNDFRTVDYDALSMLNISATQELARKVAVLERANEILKAQNAKLMADIAHSEVTNKAYIQLAAQVMEMQKLLGIGVKVSTAKLAKK